MQQTPWWVFLLLAPVLYAVIVYGLPALMRGERTSPLLVPLVDAMLKPIAVFAAVVLGLLSAKLWYRQRQSRALLDRQKDLATVRALHWQELERLVGEAYRRQGYRVLETGRRGPDGGVDLVVEKNGRHLVQCKHWKAYTVGVKEVRELFGIVAAERADGGILVTCGDFTAEARAFAAENPIELVDGRRLVELVKTAQTGSPSSPPRPDSEAAAARACPRCGAAMVVRVAKRGAKPGSRFLGCSGYPRCQATADLPD